MPPWQFWLIAIILAPPFILFGVLSMLLSRIRIHTERLRDTITNREPNP